MLKMYDGSISSQVLLLCRIFEKLLDLKDVEIFGVSLLDQFASTELLTSLGTVLDVNYKDEDKALGMLRLFKRIVAGYIKLFGLDSSHVIRIMAILANGAGIKLILVTLSYHLNIKSASTIDMYVAASVLFRLLVYFPALRVLGTKAGVYEALLLGLRAYPAENGEFTDACFDTTSFLALDNSPLRDSMAAVGACEILVASMRAHVKQAGTTEADVDRAISGCRAIHALAHQAGPAIMDRLLTTDAAGVLLEALLVYRNYKAIVNEASEAILSLCDHEGHRKALLRCPPVGMEAVPVIGDSYTSIS